MSTATAPASQLAAPPPAHTAAFRRRRFLNWFPMGLTYAFLYMGRYNLTVGKNALGDLMTKEDFGLIFGAGTVTYAFAFLLNGPLTDRMGGKRGIVAAALGSAVMNLAMGLYLSHALSTGASHTTIRLWFSVLYALNMYFQSFGAVAIVKVNAHWFHVRERGGFSGIFGTMISSGIFFAFTVNSWLLDLFTAHAAAGQKALEARWVFLVPAAILFAMFFVEIFLLRDKPSQAGLDDFDTGDASSGDDAGRTPTFELMRRILTHPVILTVACIEFCTGVLRNGVMHWYPIYVKEVSALPSSHYLNNGSWGSPGTIVPFFVVAAVLFGIAAATKGPRKGVLIASGGFVFLLPFLQGGWGGIQMVAGVIGGNVAGYVSDLFFQSRRAPAAAGLYVLLLVCTVAMTFSLGQATNVLAKGTAELHEGDRILAVDGTPVSDWLSAKRTFACLPALCDGGASWDAEACVCSSHPEKPSPIPPRTLAGIPFEVERGGVKQTVIVSDPAVRVMFDGSLRPRLRAGDGRVLGGSPVLSVSPYLLGVLVFLMSLCVIGTHGVLSGTATMDFGGRKGAATAVGMIDGFVYLGTALQSFSLGYLTSRSWSYWPFFLVPFAVIGLFLCTRIWSAAPKSGAAAH